MKTRRQNLEALVQDKLSWADTFKETALAKEDWSEWDAIIPPPEEWDDGSTGLTRSVAQAIHTP